MGGVEGEEEEEAVEAGAEEEVPVAAIRFVLSC